MDPTKVVPLVEKLIPPADSDPAKVRIWRIYIAMATLVNSIVLAAHVAWACGFLPGFSGFALAADFEDTKQAQVLLTREILEQRIFDMRVRQCVAIKEHEPAAVLQAYAKMLSDLKHRYEDLMGTEPEVPDCNEV